MQQVDHFFVSAVLDKVVDAVACVAEFPVEAVDVADLVFVGDDSLESFGVFGHDIERRWLKREFTNQRFVRLGKPLFGCLASGMLVKCRSSGIEFVMDLAEMLLTIDTSSDSGSLCLSDSEGRILLERSFSASRTNNVDLFPVLADAMEELQKSDRTLSAILVGTGPGSYSGVRIALAAAVGVAVAKGAEVYGRGTLESHSWEQRPDCYYGFGDARRGKYFRLAVRNGHQDREATLMSEEESLAWLAEAESQSLPVLLLDPLARFKGHLLERVQDLQSIEISASSLARNWLKLSDEEREASKNPSAFYLRPPHITPAKAGHPLHR